jgi:serine/threonine protein kinase
VLDDSRSHTAQSHAKAQYRADLAKAQRVHNGHAEVYRLASDTAIGEEGSLAGWLAVKVVSAYSNRPPHDVRQEVALLRRLRDPHLVRLVTSYLSDSHDHHLVLPYYPLPLDILLASDRFTPARLDESPFSQVVKAIIRQASSGLAYLHEQGIAHRDVKPGNLVIGSTGRLVLIDLGTAHDTKSSSNAERPGSMVFDVGSGCVSAAPRTPVYIAEQVVQGARGPVRLS